MTQIRPPADPFLEHVPAPYTCALYALGVPVRFESNRRWLLRLAEAAFAGLPSASPANTTPVQVRLIANSDLPADAFESPPTPLTYSDSETFVMLMSPADVGVCVPRAGKGLVTVSPALARFPYNVRYELIEFVAYRLANHRLGGVSIHAGCVARGDASLLMLGPSGAGKSTLVYAGLNAGWDLIAEDGVFVLPHRPHRPCRLRGAPNFVHLRDDAWRLFDARPIQGQPILRRSGRSKLEIDARQLTHAARRAPRIEAPLGDLIFLDAAPARDDTAAPQLRPLNRDQARRRILAQQPYAAQQVAWPRVLEALLRRPAYVLHRSTRVRDSVELLSRLMQP